MYVPPSCTDWQYWSDLFLSSPYQLTRRIPITDSLLFPPQVDCNPVSSTAHLGDVLERRAVTQNPKEKLKNETFGCILVINLWSIGFGFVYLTAYLQTWKHRRIVSSWMELSLQSGLDVVIVHSHCTLLHKAVATYFFCIALPLVCLGCFIKALKVSSSLYRDTKWKNN